MDDPQINVIFSFLVHPAKGEEEQPEIGGALIPLSGNLFKMLSNQFEKSEEECKIDIAFIPREDGQQYNECRSDIIEILKNQDLNHARLLATRLQTVTTHRSGLGLLFIIIGSISDKKRIYISRFPADVGIIAEEKKNDLHVELIEKVFMKNALSYKAVVYEDSNFSSGFWTGKAIDRQINNKAVAISGYWIKDFLKSDFETTSATGTRRLAMAIRKTIDSTNDLDIKEELSAAALLSRSLNKQPITIENFWERFGLSEKTRDAVMGHLATPAFRFDRFYFSSKEFGKHIRYRSISIDNGAMLTAPVGKFEECFSKRLISDERREYEFSTRGSVVDERLRKESR